MYLINPIALVCRQRVCVHDLVMGVDRVVVPGYALFLDLATSGTGS